MKKILIANRAEIARRIIHTAHRMGIETVAVYADPDAHALHVREATQAASLGGAESADSYLRIDKLLAAARATGADAVHPGYGFLSENADFAQAVIDAGLAWIGPPPAAIRALGNKAGAKALAAQQGVPCLPGYAGTDPHDGQSDARFVAEAARIGFPLMVKAVAGGGGRGMRLVTDAAQLPAALVSARSEALAGFGCGDLLIERALLQPRHVEVQIFADAHGHCIHLGERDCSVQRRHQKIIEESPSPAVDAALRTHMGACAVALAQGAGYVGAGTVEFLLDGAQFFLMEMNTRLQVEHPVTEALTGLDLVEWQIRIARGEPLPLTQDQVALHGHAIEVRLCAEDAHFRPHTGRVRYFDAPPATAFERAPLGGLRFDHALAQGGEVSAFYDAMLGKLIVHAATRGEAIDALVRALQGTTLLGLPTNRAFLAACLDHPDFRAGQALVPFLTGQADGLRDLLLKVEQQGMMMYGLAAVLTQNSSKSVPAGAPAPLSLPCAFARPMRLRQQGDVQALSVLDQGHGRWQVTGVPSVPGGDAANAQFSVGADGRIACTWNGLTQQLRAVPVAPAQWHWQAGGVDGWVEDVSYAPAPRAGAAGGATELRAPFNGRVVAVPVVAGQVLAAGDTVVVIESMKLEHSVCSTGALVVAELLVAPGQQVTPGQVLARLEALPAPATPAASIVNSQETVA